MAKVTYNAPKGDNKVAEMRGHEFFDGQTKDLDDTEHADLIGKLRNHPHFTVKERKSKTSGAEAQPATDPATPAVVTTDGDPDAE